MSRHPVTELWVQRQGAALVRVSSEPPAESGSGDLQAWVNRSALPAPAMLAGGLTLGLAGAGLAVFGPGGLAAAAMFSAMITLGGGLTFLAVLKRRRARKDAAAAVTMQTSPEVSAERGRRVHAALLEGGDATFETLVRFLGWTEAALLETLVQMKEAGAVEEDLNMDTGEWFYRVRHDFATGAGGGLMLEDRQAKADAEDS